MPLPPPSDSIPDIQFREVPELRNISMVAHPDNYPAWGGCGRCGASGPTRERCSVCTLCFTGCCTCTTCPGNGSGTSHAMIRPLHVHTCGRCMDHCMCNRCPTCGRSHDGVRRIACTRCGNCRAANDEAGITNVCCNCVRPGEVTSISYTDDLGPHDNRPVVFMRSKTYKDNPLRRFISIELEIGRDKGNADEIVQPVLKKYGMTAKEDGSVYSGCEITTQPSNGDEFLTQVRDLTTALNAVGARVDATCGYHVHIDARDYTWQSLRRMLILWSRVEAGMFLALPQARRTSRFARALAPQIDLWFPDPAERISLPHLKDRVAQLVKGQRPTPFRAQNNEDVTLVRWLVANPEAAISTTSTGCNCFSCRSERLDSGTLRSILAPVRAAQNPRFQLVENRELIEHSFRPTNTDRPGVFLDGYVDRHWRYYTLNVLSWFSHGTIEVRCHSGTTNYHKIVNWALLWANFIDRCRHISEADMIKLANDPRDSWDLLVEVFAPSDEIRQWLIARRALFDRRAIEAAHPHDDETIPVTPPRRRR